jgi:hypothetical protein
MATGPDENHPEARRKQRQRLPGVNRARVSATLRRFLFTQGMEEKLRRGGVQRQETLAARLAQRLGRTIQSVRRRFGKANGGAADLKDPLPQANRSVTDSGRGLPAGTMGSIPSGLGVRRA